MCKLPTPPPQTSMLTAPSYSSIWGRTIWPEKEKSAELQQVLRDDKAIMSFDGSLKDGHGMEGWELTIRTGQMTGVDIPKGAAPVDCNPDEQSST